MPPGSPSSAGHQLRRAKSTASARTQPSQPPVASFIDDPALKQQALIAAMTAFESANGREVPRASLDRAQLQRRRSQKNCSSEGEGSHLQAGQLRRRQSGKRLSTDSVEGHNQGRARRLTVNSGSSISTTEYHRQQYDTETSINRNSTLAKHESSSLTFRKIRKSRSLYSAGSQQEATSIDEVQFYAHGPTAPANSIPDGTLQSIAETDAAAELTTNDLLCTVKPSYHVDPNVSKARDQHLNQFQTQSVRSRPSFMFTPFKKRQDRIEAQYTGSSDNGVTYDNVVSSPIAPASAVQRKASCEARTTSLSIKERIRRVFRRSTVSRNLPVQHVEATRKHFGEQLTERSQSRAEDGIRQTAPCQSEIQTSRLPDLLGPPTQSIRAASPAQSDATLSTSKSRVTSWTNSTITATAASRCSDRLSSIQERIHEDAALNAGSRTSSNGSSIFKRIVRKVSRMEVNSPPSEQDNPPEADEDIQLATSRQTSNGTSTSGSAHDTLPSQRKRSSLLNSKPSLFLRSTVRAVTPDVRAFQSSKEPQTAPTPTYRLTPTPFKHGLPTTAAELLERSRTPAVGKDSVPRVRNRLQKAPPKTTKPTTAQIESRVERSNDRWKSPLEEGSRSLFYPRSPRGHDRLQGSTDNGSPVEKVKTDGIARVDSRTQRRRADTISPSLYSRGTDSESIPPISAIANNPNGSNVSVGSNRSSRSAGTGTAVIGASTPVASYTIGSSSQNPDSHRPQPSADWRAWLSKEVEDLGTPPPDDIILSGNVTIRRKPHSGHHREYQQIVDPEDVTVSSSESSAVRSRTSSGISDGDRPLGRIREAEKQASRSESRMNERFPLIETGRPASGNKTKNTPPSDKSQAKRNSPPTTSSKGKERASDPLATTEPRTLRPGNENIRPNSTSAVPKIHRSKSTLPENTRPNIEKEEPTNRPQFITSPPRPSLNTYKSTPQIRPRPSSALETNTPPNTLRPKPLTPTPNRGTYVMQDIIKAPHTAHAHPPAQPSRLRYMQSAYNL